MLDCQSLIAANATKILNKKHDKELHVFHPMQVSKVGDHS